MNTNNLAFHPNPSRPNINLPNGACDAHCHVFGPETDFPFAETRTYTPVDAPWTTLNSLHQKLGLSRTVLVQASCHGTDNRAMLDAISRSDGCCRGVAMVDVDVTDEQLHELHVGGIRGIRFNFVSHLGKDANLSAVESLCMRIAPLGWHAVIHFEADRLETLAPILKRLPLTMVIDHMGRPDASKGLEQQSFRMLLELMEDKRFWVKVCGAERISKLGPPYEDAVPFAQKLISKFPDRVLWGTDWPHPNIKKNMPDDGKLVNLLSQFTKDPKIIKKLLVTNPTRLYWPEISES